MKHTFITICFLLISFNTLATNEGIVVNLGSKHFVSNDTDYNEQNYGLAYSTYSPYDLVGTQVGFFYNSEHHWSTYGVYKFYEVLSEKTKPFMMVGVATGYKISTLAPILAFGFDLEIIKSHKLNFILSPFSTAHHDPEQSQTKYGVVLGFQYEKLF